MDKQIIITEFLRERLNDVKIGIIVKGVEDILPEKIVCALAKEKDHLYAAIVGYDSVVSHSEKEYEISSSIEKAVLWRSDPQCAGSILVFVRSDIDKLHSLAEFDVVTTRDIAHFLLGRQIHSENNTPTNNFWKALQATSDYYTFDALYEFVSNISQDKNPAEAIPQNMWRLNLLRDDEILGTKIKPEERLEKNRNLIFAIAQLNEDSRRKLSHTLVRIVTDDQKRLQNAYTNLQSFYKYGSREILKSLDLETVQELLSAAKKTEKRKKKLDKEEENVASNENAESAPIQSKELERLISESVVFGDEDEQENIHQLLEELNEFYDEEKENKGEVIHSLGGVFQDRNILPKAPQEDLRKLVGSFCDASAWGGIMETEECILKDAISADHNAMYTFDPEDKNSVVAFSGGIDGSQALFDFIIQFDAQFDSKGLETTERFSPIIADLKARRKELISSIDLIMYYPILLFGASDENRMKLINYIKAWEKLYHTFCQNEPIMRQISAGGTSFIARALLLLDVLYIKTPNEWKGILLPLHPVYLWRFYEVFRSLPQKKSTLSDDDKDALSKVLPQLPHALNFIVANSIITGSEEERVLPCSGSIEMLPTFENKTNRYLGNDGTESVAEILTRWVGFAPYTRTEIRICSVDAPDLAANIKQIKDFMDHNDVRKVVYDVYLTRSQNGNTELAKLDYSGNDYEIGEYIRSNKISISIHNVKSSTDVKVALTSRPVHVAFYFDQSSYSIEYGPSNHNLYISPLVINYDYDFDEIQHKGCIYPSSETDSGLIGDYHQLMRTADVISHNSNPRTTYSGNADMSSVVSTIKDGQTQWLVVADRDTNNYQPEESIPIGEMQYDKRMVNVWAANKSRIVSQYMVLLRGYNLYPKEDVLVDILHQFGHIASNGLISIPRYGADTQSVDNKKKGLVGTLFAASWYTNRHENALVASLDDNKARLWLQNSKYGNERADLIGLYYEENTDTLHIEPIEVKTRDESPDAVINRDENGQDYIISGHAADQIANMVVILQEIFTTNENQMDMFTSARREVLKYQIVSECFRNIHDSNWQKKWYTILKRAFSDEAQRQMTVSISGLLLHIKLNEAYGKETIQCVYTEADDCKITYWKLTTKEIQQDILGGEIPIKEEISPDFDSTEKFDETRVSSDSENIDLDSPPDTLDSKSQFQFESNDSDHVFEETHTNSTNDHSYNTDDTPQVPKQENPSPMESEKGVSRAEIEQLVKDFKRSCGDYHVSLKECDPENAVVGPSVIRLKFRLGRGQALQGLSGHLEDIGREMKRSGTIIQQVPNSDELLLDVPRLNREEVLFRDVINFLPKVTSPEQLYFPLGRTPNGKDLFEDLGQMPHMLVGGSTGSGKSVFLFSMLAALLMTHPHKDELQLILSSSKIEDFTHFEGLPHLYSGNIISDAEEATHVIREVIFEESERRGKLLSQARVANIIEYNKIAKEKLAPIVVVIDEFADLADQLETKKEQNEFYKPVQRIAQAGRSRGIHLVICTQRPEAKLVPSTTKAQLNGRVALRVNDGISSRMIIEEPDAQYLQKHGDMIYRNGDIIERAQGYLIEIPELDQIVQNIINENNNA